MLFKNFFNDLIYGELLTSIIVPSYAYTYIKLDFLKQLIIDDNTLNKLREIDKIQEFIDLIGPYYPDIKIKNYTIEEIENALYGIFIKLIGKIISFSPKNMQRFLRSYLFQFEIVNVKQIILGSILGMTKQEKSENVNFFVEELLGNTEFINSLLDITSLDEIQLFMRGTRYYKSIREGLLYFKNYNEVFILEAFLDQLYYLTMVKEEKLFTRKERNIINLYIDSITEIYNLNVIYRGIINKIDKKLLSQFIIKNYFFLDENQIYNLLNQENTDNFIVLIDKTFRNIENIKKFYTPISINIEHLKWWIERIYTNNFFNKFKPKYGDIDYITILKIIEIIIKKQKEIQLDILPNAVNIIHKKYEILK